MSKHSKQFNGLVLFIRFPLQKKHIKNKLEELARNNDISANQLSIKILEAYVDQQTQMGKISSI